MARRDWRNGSKEFSRYLWVTDLERRDAERFRQRHEIIVVIGIELVQGRLAMHKECCRDVDCVLGLDTVVPDDFTRGFSRSAI